MSQMPVMGDGRIHFRARQLACGDVTAGQVFDIIKNQADLRSRQGLRVGRKPGDDQMGDHPWFEYLPEKKNHQYGQTAPQGRQHAIISGSRVQRGAIAYVRRRRHWRDEPLNNKRGLKVRARQSAVFWDDIISISIQW